MEPDTGPRPGLYTVLVVEDDRAVRALVCRVLQRSGYRVLEAEDPEQALDLADRCDDPIELLLTDMVMPQMSGLDVFRRLADLRPELRLLLMSGYSGVIADAGLSDEPRIRFIDKPFTVGELLEAVGGILGAPSEP